LRRALVQNGQSSPGGRCTCGRQFSVRGWPRPLAEHQPERPTTYRGCRFGERKLGPFLPAVEYRHQPVMGGLRQGTSRFVKCRSLLVLMHRARSRKRTEGEGTASSPALCPVRAKRGDEAVPAPFSNAPCSV